MELARLNHLAVNQSLVCRIKFKYIIANRYSLQKEDGKEKYEYLKKKKCVNKYTCNFLLTAQNALCKAFSITLKEMTSGRMAIIFFNEENMICNLERVTFFIQSGGLNPSFTQICSQPLIFSCTTKYFRQHV